MDVQAKPFSYFPPSKREKEREGKPHAQQVTDEGAYLRQPVFFPFSSDAYRAQKNKQKTTIIYTMKREDKIIDSESCVNVREWCAFVNMVDRLLRMLV